MSAWTIVGKCHPAAAALADRHYSRRKVGSPQFMPPGQTLVLLTADERAVFGWWRPHPASGLRAMNGLNGWTCTIFRNESPALSSDLILAAERELLDHAQRRPPHRNPRHPTRHRRRGRRMTAEHLCVLDHHGHHTPAARGILLCTGHAEQLDQDLNDCDLLLALIHDMALPGPGDGNARGKPVDAAAPARLDAIAAIDLRTLPDPPGHGDTQIVSVTAIISRWTRHLIDARHLATRPATAHTALTLIRTHLDWLLNDQDTDLFATDLHDAAHMLRRTAGEIRPPIGRHHAPHPHHPDRDCGGRLYPMPWQFGVWCIDCGERYDGHQELRRLGLVLEGN